MKKVLTALAALIVAPLLLTGCFGGPSDAEVASKNLSTAADQFEIDRRIVFFNGITDKYLMLVEGKCSIESAPGVGALAVTCKTGPKEFKKHYFGRSDNVSYFVEQTSGSTVSTSRYRVIFKPEAIVPNFDRP